MNKLVLYVFLLLLITVALAYYVGLKSDANVVGNWINTLLQTISGRQNNQFAAYPASE